MERKRKGEGEEGKEKCVQSLREEKEGTNRGKVEACVEKTRCCVLEGLGGEVGDWEQEED